MCYGRVAVALDGVPAGVKGNGAVLLGRGFTVDGHWSRPFRVVTHAHSDHLLHIRRSVRECMFIVANPYTFRFMDVLGYSVPEEKRLALDYGVSVDLDGETVTLFRSRHIPGSSVVVVEGRGYRVGYTGDFKVPGTDVVEGLDVLVLDATYGSVRLQRRWGEAEALASLVEIIERYIDRGPVWVYGYNGKLQEVMVELRIRGVDYPFLADYKTLKLAEIASEFYGVDLGEVRPYSGGPVDESVVVFTHMTRRRSLARLPGIHVVLTGWELRSPAAWAGDNLIRVSFSDHATFKEVIQYVMQTKPRMVIVDGYRGKDAWYTARYIEKTLGIPSRVEP